MMTTLASSNTQLSDAARDNLWLHFTRHSGFEKGAAVPVISRGEVVKDGECPGDEIGGEAAVQPLDRAEWDDLPRDPPADHEPVPVERVRECGERVRPVGEHRRHAQARPSALRMCGS